MPVLRIYRVRLHPGREADYDRLERDVGMPAVRAMPGCLGCGYGPFKEGKEWAFVSLWADQAALDAARASADWARMVAAIGAHGTVASESAEHLQLSWA